MIYYHSSAKASPVSCTFSASTTWRVLGVVSLVQPGISPGSPQQCSPYPSLNPTYPEGLFSKSSCTNQLSQSEFPQKAEQESGTVYFKSDSREQEWGLGRVNQGRGSCQCARVLSCWSPWGSLLLGPLEKPCRICLSLAQLNGGRGQHLSTPFPHQSRI